MNDPDKPTILIFRIGSIGDTVVALPCFHQIARCYATMRRVLVTDSPVVQKSPAVESVLGSKGLIDSVIYFPPTPRSLRDVLRLRSEIMATQARTLVYIADRDLPRVLRDIAFFRLCGIREIIGAPLIRDLRRPRFNAEDGTYELEAQRLTRCLAALGPIDLNDPAMWDLALEPSELRAGDAALAAVGKRKFIALNMGGKVGSKDWGDENWQALLQMIAADHSEFALVLFGSGDETARAGSIAANWPGQILNLCGKLTPRQSAAALRRALVFVGHDSGPMHLAATVGVPCVCMFGNFNMPKVWHPYGEQHRILHDMRGVRTISPASVHKELQFVINSPNAGFSNQAVDPALEPTRCGASLN